MFYGPGAGKLPTASAVVADIIDIIANRDADPKPIVWEQAAEGDLGDFSKYACRRMFIFNGTELPSGMPEGTAKVNGSMCALVTSEAISEKQTEELVKLLGDKLASVYRVL